MKEFFWQGVKAIFLFSLVRYFSYLADLSDLAVLLWGIVPLVVLLFLSVDGSGSVELAKLTATLAVGSGLLWGYTISQLFPTLPLILSAVLWWVVSYCSRELAATEKSERAPVAIAVLFLCMGGVAVFFWQWGRVSVVLVLSAIVWERLRNTPRLPLKRRG